MADVLAHPFRLQGTEVVKVNDGTDPGLAQMLAVLVTTRRGERPMVPGFGVTDPAFLGLNAAEVNAGLEMFGPAIEVSTVEAEPVDDYRQRTVITFAPRGGSA